MKRPFTIYIPLLAVIICGFPGCRKNQPVNGRQIMLFQFEYVNYSLNYDHYGFIIDNEGNVLEYKNPEAWNFPDRDLKIGVNQVAENMALCSATGIKIQTEELRKYSGHIVNMAASRVSALKPAADNAGSAEYICWQYNENSGLFKGTIIKMEGNFTCENMNFYSRKTAEWMKDIHNQVISK
jgi:hypothetical protein